MSTESSMESAMIAMNFEPGEGSGIKKSMENDVLENNSKASHNARATVSHPAFSWIVAHWVTNLFPPLSPELNQERSRLAQFLDQLGIKTENELQAYAREPVGKQWCTFFENNNYAERPLLADVFFGIPSYTYLNENAELSKHKSSRHELKFSFEEYEWKFSFGLWPLSNNPPKNLAPRLQIFPLKNAIRPARTSPVEIPAPRILSARSYEIDNHTKNPSTDVSLDAMPDSTKLLRPPKGYLSSALHASPAAAMKSVALNLQNLPYEVLAKIADSLCRHDQAMLRLTCRNIERKSTWFFKTIVLPFPSWLYSSNPTKERKIDTPVISPLKDEQLSLEQKDGFEMFAQHGQYVREFALALEFDEEILALPLDQLRKPPPPPQASFWGFYYWPDPTAQCFAQLENMEAAAGNENVLKKLFDYLTGVTSLGLSLNSGLGWLNGPDQHDNVYVNQSVRNLFAENSPRIFKTPREFLPQDTRHKAFYRRHRLFDLFPAAEDVEISYLVEMFVQYVRILEAHQLTSPEISEMLFGFMKMFWYVRFHHGSMERLGDLAFNIESTISSTPSLSGQHELESTSPSLASMSQGLTFAPPMSRSIRDDPTPESPRRQFWSKVYSLIDQSNMKPWGLSITHYNQTAKDASGAVIQNPARRNLDPPQHVGSQKRAKARANSLAQRTRPFRKSRIDQIVPCALRTLQRRALIEYGFAQTAFLQSFVLCVMDRHPIVENIQILNLTNISSSYLPALNRRQFWKTLKSVSKVTLLVSPDWRSYAEGYPRVFDLNQQSEILPSCAASEIQTLLEKQILRMERIQHLCVGYVGGGEHATGWTSRNKHILPAPLFACGTNGTMILNFQHVKHLTLENCWATARTMERLVFQSKLVSLSLDSFSLLAFDGHTMNDCYRPMYSIAGTNSPFIETHLDFDVRLRCMGDNNLFAAGAAEWEEHLTVTRHGDAAITQLPLPYTWSCLLDRITPGKNFEELRDASGQTLDGDEFARPRYWPPRYLERLELHSVGYIMLGYQVLPPGYRYEDPVTGLDKADWQRWPPRAQHFKRLEEMMLSADRRDIYCGSILSMWIWRETEMLAYGMKIEPGCDHCGTKNHCDPSAEPRDVDGFPHHGSGRYSGVLVRSNPWSF